MKDRITEKEMLAEDVLSDQNSGLLGPPGQNRDQRQLNGVNI